MSEKTNIGWTDSTFNIAWGCERVSPGCKNCYADPTARRYGFTVWGPFPKPRRIFGEKYWAAPLKWNRQAEVAGRRHKVFACSMCDVFEDHPIITAERKKLWPLIRETPWLDWQILTKRAHRIQPNLPADWGLGYPNVWLGVSVEDDPYVTRAEILSRIPAAVRFVSYEPALGPLPSMRLVWVDWVIYGGESGQDFRPDNVEWARDMRGRCGVMGKAFFHKQSSGLTPGMGVLLDGELVQEFPVPRSVGQEVAP